MTPRLTTLLCALLTAAAVLAASITLAPPAAASRSAHVKKERVAKRKAKARSRCKARRRTRRAARCRRARTLRRYREAPQPSEAVPAPHPASPPPEPPKVAPPANEPASGPAESQQPAAPAREHSLFAPDSVWNAALPDDAPLDPDSTRLSTALGQEVWFEATRYYGVVGPWINSDHYSTPVYRVGADVAPVKVVLDVDVPALQRDFEAVPIPDGARPAAGDDGSMTIYQPSTDTLWEFWIARREGDGWHARWGGKMTHVSDNPGYFPNPFGATATSLPLVGGLMTIDELQAGTIDHALAIAIPNTAEGVSWPAQRGDGHRTGPTAIPEGTHFRIDPSVDVTKLGLSPVALAMAKAAQRYGMIVRDTSSCVTFYAEDPAGRTDDPYSRLFGGQYPDALLQGFPWDRLQVVAPRGG